MWTYSIEFETKDEEGNVRYGSTAVAAATCFDAVETFRKNAAEGTDIREVRRVRHD